ncbi:MAG: 7-cyano-7-deazaguanine synthase QueC [Chloroflexota bacterium]
MRALVLFSGGLDSSTTLAIARHEGMDASAVSFSYGQKHLRELQAATAIAAHYGVRHRTVTLPLIAGSTLTDGGDIPRERPLHALDETVAPTYVPNRNMIMLARAAAMAYAEDALDLYGGWNVLDASNYPDCREVFLRATEQALRLATERPFVVHRPLITLTKGEIIQRALELSVPLHETWSCYLGADRPCLSCDTCLLRTRGFLEAKLPDPALTALEWGRARDIYLSTQAAGPGARAAGQAHG